STRPLTVGADGRPLHAHHDAAATFSAPADYGLDFGPENSSTFYRNATYASRAASTGIAPPTLVLKELPLTPFDGDIRQYPAFRNRFLDIVEAQRNLEPRFKLQYLLNYLRGEPYRLAEGFPITDASYFTVIDLLETRYGNTHKLRQRLQQELFELQPPGSSSSSLQQFHDQAFRAYNLLRQSGTTDDRCDLLVDVLMGKLPANLRREVIQHPDYQRSKTVGSVLQALRDYLHVSEEVAASGVAWYVSTPASTATFGSGPPGNFGHTTNRGTSHRSSAADNAFSYVADLTDATCAFCSSCAHNASDCHVYATAPARLRRLRELKRCFLCLQEGHQSRSCPQRPAPPSQGSLNFYHRALCSSSVRPAPMDDTTTMQPCSQSPGRPHDEPGAVQALCPPTSTGFPRCLHTEGRRHDGAHALPRIPAVPCSIPGTAIRHTGGPHGGPSCPRDPTVGQSEYAAWTTSEADPSQSKELRTALEGGSTTLSPTSTTVKSQLEQGADASGDDDSLLSRRQYLCKTDHRSHGPESTQSSRTSTEVACCGRTAMDGLPSNDPAASDKHRQCDVWDSAASGGIREEARHLSLRSFEEDSPRHGHSLNTSRFDSDAGPTAVPTPATTTA
ncbi:Pao retrotransposon peptidase family protein-like, partial [Aphelenchoides avenae]